MSTQPNDGGPAFPGAYFDHLEGIGEVRREQYHGMTLRDYFAAQAITFLAPQSHCSDEAIASFAYNLADAMLAARERKGKK